MLRFKDKSIERKHIRSWDGTEAKHCNLGIHFLLIKRTITVELEKRSRFNRDTNREN